MADEVDILIVDDRAQDVLAITSILTSVDYRLVTASTAADALRRLLDREYAVILLDVLMPDMDGFELAAIIKKRPRSRDTPIIFLTAAGPDAAFAYRGYSVGAADYLTKPLDAEILRAKVGIFVELFRKDRRIREQAEALRVAERRERDVELAEIRQASARRYRNLAEAIPQIVVTTDDLGVVAYFNQRWFEYTGQTPAEAEGEGWVAALHPDDLERYREQWQAAQASPQMFELECRLRARDGADRWHLCRLFPERASDDTVIGWIGTYTDFDDRKRALMLAEDAVQARDEFLSIASHEFRTPLTTLRLRLQSLERALERDGDGPHDPAMAARLGTALKQCDRMKVLIDSLLDVSRITSGHLTLQKESFDLAEAVGGIVETFAEVAQRARCPLELHLEGPTFGTWDRLRVEQILQNLLSNAFKYAPAAPVEVSVTADEARAALTVRDHGMGISADDVDRIFGKFGRARGARNVSGLGMGLYIAQQLARAHGGEIRVSSELGAGSTFVVELPRSPPAPQA